VVAGRGNRRGGGAVSSLLHRLWSWLTRRQRLQASVAVPVPPRALAAPKQRRVPLETPAVIYLPAPPKLKFSKPRKQTAKLKAAVLERLGDYEVYIKRLRRWDSEAYAMYRRLGAYVSEDNLEINTGEIEPEALKILPAFGAVALGARSNKDDDTIYAKFLYFIKLDKPAATIERTNIGATYRLHMYWDDKDEKKLTGSRGHGFGKDYMVNVAPDGTVRALRVMQNQKQVIRHHNGSSSIVNHQRWGIPRIVWDKHDKDLTPNELIRSAFIWALNLWLTRAHHSMIRVTATKGNIVMPFVVDATATPQFFVDREPVVVDGVTKRIFHIVRPHQRHTSRGTRSVKLHFSGLREFTWNGYSINITVPGRDHFDLTEFDVGALDADMAEEGIEYKEVAELANWLADQINAPGKVAQAVMQ
jgi:hypothetical protein